MESLPPELILEILRILQQDAKDGRNIVWITVCRFVCNLWRDLLRPFPSLPQYLEPLSAQRKEELGLSGGEAAKLPPITFAAVVCEIGSIDLLIWARDLGCIINASACAAAARGGQLETLEWLRERGVPWDKQVSYNAALRGHLALLEWARAHKSPLPAPERGWGKREGFNPLCAAARGGHIEVLKWLRGQDIQHRQNEVTQSAAAAGHFDVLMWLIQTAKFSVDADALLAEAAEHGHLDIVMWCAGKAGRACPYLNAIRNGHIRVLEYLRDQEMVTFSGQSIEAAVEAGQLEMLVWLREVAGCPWDYNTAFKAAKSGHLNVLKYVVEHGCPLTPGPFENHLNLHATAIVHTEVVKYLIGLGTPEMTLDRLCNLAAEKGNLELLMWLMEIGCTYNQQELFGSATVRGHLKVLRWLHEERGWPIPDDIANKAAFSGHVAILEWLRSIGCSFTTLTCERAAKGGHLEALKWLREVADCAWDGMYTLIPICFQPWLLSHHSLQLFPIENTITAAREMKHYEVGSWAERHGCPLPTFRHLKPMHWNAGVPRNF